MRPSDFAAVKPWNSVMNQVEHEIVAVNIMKILERNGDNWQYMTWEDYAAEREKDGNFSQVERQYFDKVSRYCRSEETAVLFSKRWDL